MKLEKNQKHGNFGNETLTSSRPHGSRRTASIACRQRSTQNPEDQVSLIAT